MVQLIIGQDLRTLKDNQEHKNAQNRKNGLTIIAATWWMVWSEKKKLFAMCSEIQDKC